MSLLDSSLKPLISPSLVKIIWVDIFSEILDINFFASFTPISMWLPISLVIFPEIYFFSFASNTLPSITILSPFNMHNTASGDEQPPPTVFKNFLSSLIQIWVDLSCIFFRIEIVFLSSFLNSTAKAPWPAAGIISSDLKYLEILCSKPNLFKPAAASIIPSSIPSSSFLILVSTFPLMLFTLTPL